ncbi:MAG: hypothetical protein H7A36_04970 [Chlamydiales bacterium]|nr:hypothetical protein [Chlamydiales bacterium]
MFTVRTGETTADGTPVLVRADRNLELRAERLAAGLLFKIAGGAMAGIIKTIVATNNPWQFTIRLAIPGREMERKTLNFEDTAIDLATMTANLFPAAGMMSEIKKIGPEEYEVTWSQDVNAASNLSSPNHFFVSDSFGKAWLAYRYGSPSPQIIESIESKVCALEWVQKWTDPKFLEEIWEDCNRQ